ncbi:MAG: hypothetical protein QXJ52_06205 [Candidatus Korarchaeota archaeon]|nr:hypothetical protein [Thermoproteota archaeon]
MSYSLTSMCLSSYKNVRRLATYLVENDELWTEGREAFVMKLYYYENVEMGVEIYDYKGEELHHRIALRKTRNQAW